MDVSSDTVYRNFDDVGLHTVYLKVENTTTDSLNVDIVRYETAFVSWIGKHFLLEKMLWLDFCARRIYIPKPSWTI